MNSLMHRHLLFLFSLICFGLSAPLAWAHEVQLPHPKPEALAQIEPPLSGSEVFARELISRYAHLLSLLQRQQLDRIKAHLTAQQWIRSGNVPEASPREADYHRWRAEQELLLLLKSLPDVHTLDFRPGQPPRPEITRVAREVPGQPILLRVVTGNNAPVFRVQSMDFTSERDPDNYTLSIAPGGTTYALVLPENLPSDAVLAYLTLQPEGLSGAAAHRQTLQFAPCPQGQLSLRVLNEKGHPVPVLLRLTAKATQRLWEPPNAIDTTEMMNRITQLPIYGPGRAYTVYLPGPFQGPYWVVPAPFDMALPAGEWEVHLLHGIEYERVHDLFSVAAGKRTERTYRLKRPINMPARGWYAGDDHIHSRLMSDADAAKLLAYAHATDLHISNILEMGDHMRTWYLQRGFGAEFRVRLGDHWLIPGQEDPRSALGHAIGLNLQSKVRDMEHYYLNDVIAGEMHRQGGLYGHTHVGSGVKELFTEREMALYTPLGIVDFNSVMQAALGTDLFYDFLNMGFRMTATAGSDAPYGGTIGVVRTYAYVGKGKAFHPDAWFDAVKRGRTFVTNGPMLDFQVERALPGDTITLNQNRSLSVRVRAWGLRGATAPVRLRLVRFGKTIKEITATREDQEHLELQTTVEADYGGWLAVEASGRDGSEAHTTPIYIERKGFRFWDITRAEALLERQLTVLDDIEHMVADAERILRETKDPLDHWNRRIAEQAVPLRERVRQVRGVYQALRRQCESERQRRTEGVSPNQD